MPDPILPRIEGPSDLKALEIDELKQLAQECRDAICDQVSVSGGHLAPNLGVVELTIALHYVFDFGHDRLLFDVGHQCYPHKLLTGRLPLLGKLRQRGGMSGFPEPSESEYDLFSVGHAGTAISTAVGLARGDQMLGQEDRRTVALVGDASIVNGVALEGLNNAGTLQRQFLVVLNDNGMAIAKPQGSLAQHFDRVRSSSKYNHLKDRARDLVHKLPGSEAIEGVYHRVHDALEAMVYPNHFFSRFGLFCAGPVDGHDLAQLISVFRQVKDLDRPALVHCKTTKGKGFDFSAGDPVKFHSPKPFTIEGCRVEVEKGGRSFTQAFSEALGDLMEEDERVFAVTAAMPDGTGLTPLLERFPERSLDTGICESHAMDMCAGLARAGAKPFFAVYSTFVQRALDQVFQEVALQKLPVRVCMDRAGFVGGDGAVHHGFMDIAMFQSLPDVAMLAASDEPNLRAALRFQLGFDEAASFLRYPRASVATAIREDVPPYELGRAALVRPSPSGNPQIAVLAYGTQVYEARDAIVELEESGFDVALYDARFAKPVDGELLAELSAAGIAIVTVEDHALTGGFGAQVLQAMNEARLSTELVFRMGMPERWIHQASRGEQLAETGLDAAGIARRLREIAEEIGVRPRRRPRPVAGGVELGTGS